MSGVVQLGTAAEIAAARALVEASGLRFEGDPDQVVGLYEEGRLVATAARSGYVFKMFAIDADHQGGDVAGELVTELLRGGRAAGHEVFFVFTRPGSTQAFLSLNFRLLVADASAALLEYGGGLAAYAAAHADLVRPGNNGAIVVNANPFTLGHLHLVETAAARCDTLYVFVVSEDRSTFPFADRERLVREGTRHLPNVRVLETSRYSVSAATFPSYFLKRLDAHAVAQMELDVRLFAAQIAPLFSIRTRFVGQEPHCETTAAYNRTMAGVLPEYGIAFVEIPRKTLDGLPISATRVRELVAAGAVDRLAGLVPSTTLTYLLSGR